MATINEICAAYKEAITKVAHVWRNQQAESCDPKVEELGQKVLLPISQSGNQLINELDQLKNTLEYFENLH